VSERGGGWVSEGVWGSFDCALRASLRMTVAGLVCAFHMPRQVRVAISLHPRQRPACGSFLACRFLKCREVDFGDLTSAFIQVTTSAFSMSRSLVSRVVLCLFLHRAFALLLLLVSLLSTGFLCALWMSCLEASSMPVEVREESRCCHLLVGLRRPKRARSHRNTVSSQRVNMVIT